MYRPDAATRQKLRIRIAELCGATDATSNLAYWPAGRFPAENQDAQRVILSVIPNYPEDLNAVNGAEEVLLADTHDIMMYQMKLEALGQGVDWPEDAHRACWKAWHAPAWLRCIALDRTLSSDPIL